MVPSGPGDKQHLFAILIEPLAVDGYGSQPMVLMVPVCTLHDGLNVETCCVLGPGDHPFIQRPSYLDYRLSRLEQVSHIEKMVQKGQYSAKEAFDGTVLHRIVAGALESRRISREYKKLLEQILFP